MSMPMGGHVEDGKFPVDGPHLKYFSGLPRLCEGVAQQHEVFMAQQLKGVNSSKVYLSEGSGILLIFKQNKHGSIGGDRAR